LHAVKATRTSLIQEDKSSNGDTRSRAIQAIRIEEQQEQDESTKKESCIGGRRKIAVGKGSPTREKVASSTTRRIASLKD